MPATETLIADSSGMARATALLRAGEVVAFPTETVYGLGGNARDAAAVARIFAAKARPSFNPLIVHVPDLSAAAEIARLDARAMALAAAFWPGPLTLVLAVRPGSGLSDLVTAGHPSVAIRVPAHPVARALLAASGLALAAPSANPSGRVSPTTAAHVAEELGGRVAAIIDGGPCSVGIESTIVDLTGPEASILRPGGVSAEDLSRVLGTDVPQRQGDPDRPSAPGQLRSHYAPGATMRLDATSAHRGEVLIGFGPVTGRFTLSPTGDLVEAASQLFAVLRAADALAGPGGAIAVAPIPNSGLGVAINDRLRRAAVPRDA
jgi:L-threonylcarbamoyladenylate synthase